MGGSHLRFKLDWKASHYLWLRSILLDDLPVGFCDVAFTFEENVWRGQSNLQLTVANENLQSKVSFVYMIL